MNKCFTRFSDKAIPEIKQYIEESYLDDEEFKINEDLSDNGEEESDDEEQPESESDGEKNKLHIHCVHCDVLINPGVNAT